MQTARMSTVAAAHKLLGLPIVEDTAKYRQCGDELEYVSGGVSREDVEYTKKVVFEAVCKIVGRSFGDCLEKGWESDFREIMGDTLDDLFHVQHWTE